MLQNVRNSKELTVKSPYLVEREMSKHFNQDWAVVVAQLVERSLPTHVVGIPNPVIGKFYLLSTVLKFIQRRKKVGNCPLIEKTFLSR